MRVFPLPDDIAGIALEPGERLILKCKYRLKPEFVEKVRVEFGREFPGLGVAIIDEAFDIYGVSGPPDVPEGKNAMKVTVNQCARCGQNHLNLPFTRLANPPSDYEFFAMCPTTNQPITMAVLPDGLETAVSGPDTHVMPGVTAVRDGGPGITHRMAFEVKDIRVERVEGQPPKIVGYAATFNSKSKPIPVLLNKGTAKEKKAFFREQISPGGFTTALSDGRDIAALIGHQPNQIVARSSSGKMILKQDDKGLAFEVTPSNAQRSTDLLADIDHGNIRGMSFGMGDDSKEEWSKDSDGTPLRTLTDVDAKEISFTPFPAYNDTSVGVRSLAALEEIETRDHPGDLNYKVVAGHCRSMGQTCRSMAEQLMRTRDLLDDMNGKPDADEAKHMRDMHDGMGEMVKRCQVVQGQVRDALGIEDDDDDDDEEESEEKKRKRAERIVAYTRSTGLDVEAVREVLVTRAGHMTHGDGAPSLNTAGVDAAKKLIADGKVEPGEWSFTAADEDALLGDPANWASYGKWFLAEDKNADEQTKTRFKYPFGKGGKVYVRALNAIRSRASQQTAKAIYDAAGELLDLIKS